MSTKASADLSDYRIFADPGGTYFLAAKKVGDEIAVLCDTEDFDRAFRRCIEDAGLKVKIVEVDGVDIEDYCPQDGDWL